MSSEDPRRIRARMLLMVAFPSLSVHVYTPTYASWSLFLTPLLRYLLGGWMIRASGVYETPQSCPSHSAYARRWVLEHRSQISKS